MSSLAAKEMGIELKEKDEELKYTIQNVEKTEETKAEKETINENQDQKEYIMTALADKGYYQYGD